MISTLLLVSLALAGPTPTATPWMGREGIDYLIGPEGLPFPVLWPKMAEAQTAVAKIPGAWIITATATVTYTKTPTPEPPHAEATCVASGHEWRTVPAFYLSVDLVDDERPQRFKGFPVNVTRTAAGGWYCAGDGTCFKGIRRCRRCSLWKEKP